MRAARPRRGPRGRCRAARRGAVARVLSFPFACTLPECHTPRSTTSRRKSHRPHRRSSPDARRGPPRMVTLKMDWSVIRTKGWRTGAGQVPRQREPGGRVDDWRGGGRPMGVAVSGGFRRAGASLLRHGSVSSRRSSNRTCGFPASGSRTRSCLRPRIAGRSRIKAGESVLVPEMKTPLPSRGPQPRTHQRGGLVPIEAERATALFPRDSGKFGPQSDLARISHQVASEGAEMAAFARRTRVRARRRT